MHVVRKKEKPAVTGSKLERGKMYVCADDRAGPLYLAVGAAKSCVCLVDLSKDYIVQAKDMADDVLFVEVEGYYVTSVEAQLDQFD